MASRLVESVGASGVRRPADRHDLERSDDRQAVPRRIGAGRRILNHSRSGARRRGPVRVGAYTGPGTGEFVVLWTSANGSRWVRAAFSRSSADTTGANMPYGAPLYKWWMRCDAATWSR